MDSEPNVKTPSGTSLAAAPGSEAQDKTAVELICEVTGRKCCPRCKCCELEWEACSACDGDGCTEPGQLYEEDPLWYDPDDVEKCHQCGGECGWWTCTCDENGKHRSQAPQNAPGERPAAGDTRKSKTL